MQKPLALFIAIGLALTGCQVFERSPTWEAVVSVRPGDCFRQPDPSSYYAEKLHGVLVEQGVEHYVVTFQFHYQTHQYEEAVSTRTAVVYRDNVNERYPWWVKDERTESPFWLPNGDLDSQLSFYCRRKVEVLEKQFYPAHGGTGKSSVSLVRPAAATPRRSVAVVEKPQPVTHIAQVKPRPAAPAPAKPVVAVRPASVKPAPVAAAAPPAATVTKIERPFVLAPVKPPAATESSAPPVSTGRANSSWTAPVVIDPVEQASDPAPRDGHLEKLFRIRNGTAYDRTSAVDRRKMEQLKHGIVGKDTGSEHGLRDTDAPTVSAAGF
jgi:hypothetical protein